MGLGRGRCGWSRENGGVGGDEVIEIGGGFVGFWVCEGSSVFCREGALLSVMSWAEVCMFVFL